MKQQWLRNSGDALWYLANAAGRVDLRLSGSGGARRGESRRLELPRSIRSAQLLLTFKTPATTQPQPARRLNNVSSSWQPKPVGSSTAMD